jgi:hypothetical protein
MSIQETQLLESVIISGFWNHFVTFIFCYALTYLFWVKYLLGTKTSLKKITLTIIGGYFIYLIVFAVILVGYQNIPPMRSLYFKTYTTSSAILIIILLHYRETKQKQILLKQV